MIDTEQILIRIGKNDRTAVKDCIDIYGSVVWSISKRYSNSTEEAENAVSEIFLDIWRCAGRFEASGMSGYVFIALIARCRMLRISKEDLKKQTIIRKVTFPVFTALLTVMFRSIGADYDTP